MLAWVIRGLGLDASCQILVKNQLQKSYLEALLPETKVEVINNKGALLRHAIAGNLVVLQPLPKALAWVAARFPNVTVMPESYNQAGAPHKTDLMRSMLHADNSTHSAQWFSEEVKPQLPTNKHITICPGSDPEAHYKRVNPGFWLDLASLLSQENNVVFCGVEEELSFVSDSYEKVTIHSVSQGIEQVQSTDVVIACCNAWSHLAAFYGKNLRVVHNVTEPSITGAIYSLGDVVIHKSHVFECFGCYHRDLNSCGDFLCNKQNVSSKVALSAGFKYERK